MNMPSDEYNKMIKVISNWSGDKDGLQRLYNDIYYKYEDGGEMLRRLDVYQRKWTMDLH